MLEKVTHDGRRVDAASDEWRHECEARYVLSFDVRGKRPAYLASIADKRGQDAADRLADTIRSMRAVQQEVPR